MRALIMAWVIVATSGCMSNPDEQLPIHGSLRSSSAPAGQAVRLRRRIQRSDGFSGACVADADAPLLKETAALDDGTWAMKVFRAEGQPLGTLGQFCFRVETEFPSGSRAWSQLNSLLLDNPVAPLIDWQTTLSLDGGLVQFEPVIPLPPDFFLAFNEPSTAPQLDHRLEVHGSTGVIWRDDDSVTEFVDGGTLFRRHALVLDEVRLEDFAGTAGVTATLTDLSLRSQYLTYESVLAPVQLQPPRELPVRGSTVPPSRGAVCPPFASPCPFTDGSLDAVDGGLVRSLTVELATASSVRAVVLRDVAWFGSEFGLELGLEDGGVWSTSRQASSHAFDVTDVRGTLLSDGGYVGLARDFVAIDLDAGSVVRVTVSFPGGLDRLRELSVF